MTAGTRWPSSAAGRWRDAAPIHLDLSTEAMIARSLNRMPSRGSKPRSSLRLYRYTRRWRSAGHAGPCPDTAGDLLWTSAAACPVTRAGRIMQTARIPRHLTATRFEDGDPLAQALGGAATRSLRLIDLPDAGGIRSQWRHVSGGRMSPRLRSSAPRCHRPVVEPIAVRS